MTTFEKKVKAVLEDQGWEVMHNGWPDFLCVRKLPNGKLEVRAVEVKTKKDELRPNQRRNMAALSTVMTVREIREGPGYGDSLNRSDMCALIFDLRRYKDYDGGNF